MREPDPNPDRPELMPDPHGRAWPEIAKVLDRYGKLRIETQPTGVTVGWLSRPQRADVIVTPDLVEYEGEHVVVCRLVACVADDRAPGPAWEPALLRLNAFSGRASWALAPDGSRLVLQATVAGERVDAVEMGAALNDLHDAYVEYGRLPELFVAEVAHGRGPSEQSAHTRDSLLAWLGDEALPLNVMRLRETAAGFVLSLRGIPFEVVVADRDLLVSAFVTNYRFDHDIPTAWLLRRSASLQCGALALDADGSVIARAAIRWNDTDTRGLERALGYLASIAAEVHERFEVRSERSTRDALSQRVTLLPADWPGAEARKPMDPGDCILGLGGEVVTGPLGDPTSDSSRSGWHGLEYAHDPYRAVPPTEPVGGLLFFDSEISLDEFHAMLHILCVPIDLKAYGVFLDMARNPTRQGFLDQVRVFSNAGLARFDAAQAELLSEQALALGEMLWQFIAHQKDRWGTGVSRELSGTFGGDGDEAQEALCFGFAVQNRYWGAYRLWSRAWLVTK